MRKLRLIRRGDAITAEPYLGDHTRAINGIDGRVATLEDAEQISSEDENTAAEVVKVFTRDPAGDAFWTLRVEDASDPLVFIDLQGYATIELVAEDGERIRFEGLTPPGATPP